MMQAHHPRVPLAARSCEGCTLCCTLLEVDELAKPPLTACINCREGVGCGIYADRPMMCGQYFCAYRVDARLDEAWKPSRCGIVVSFDDHGGGVVVQVDPAQPTAWRHAPYRAQIETWAHGTQTLGGEVVVWEGDSKVVIATGLADGPPSRSSAATP